MRITIRLDPALLRAARRYAAEAGVSLSALIEDGLREVLGRRRSRRNEPPPELPPYCGGGLKTGVTLDDLGLLRDSMDA